RPRPAESLHADADSLHVPVLRIPGRPRALLADQQPRQHRPAMVDPAERRRLTRFAAVALALVVAGCGRGTFAPDCPAPVRGSAAEPVGLVALTDGGVAAVHADTRERWCGGF